jgi:hypothetical protein
MHVQEKYFDTEINTLGGGQGAYWLKEKGLSWFLMNDDLWLWWRDCRGLESGRPARGKFNQRENERKSSGGGAPGIGRGAFYSPEDLESARHFGHGLRNAVSDGCIEQQTKCLAPYGLGDPRNRSSFEQMGCPELLTASCSIKPTGIFNTPGERCVHGDVDCGDTFDITPRCSESENIRLPVCKGFVDREIFEQKCKTQLKAWGDWREVGGACSIFDNKNSWCCRYSRGDPEIMKYFD